MKRKCNAKDNPTSTCIDFNQKAGCQCNMMDAAPAGECPQHGSGLHPKRCYYCNKFMSYE